ncbi:MAG: L-2-amino-thiazoline-4-carboxylic acid hydrolase [Spirochaetes bacterium]|nr:L-2-amino-thiazoline-4-carboxylic acid hydrolase [Spirochaetota bacterium]
MLKSKKDNPAIPGKVCILYGMLKGYVKNPCKTIYLAKKKAHKIKKKLGVEYPPDFLEMISLIAGLYDVIREKPDDRIALSLVTALILPVGLATQMSNFRFVEDKRSFDNLIAYQQKTNREGPTRLNRIEVLEQNKRRYAFKVHNCQFHDAFTKLGVPELTRVICTIDNAIFNSYMPEEVVFHRNGIGKRIADGASYCDFICEHREC